MEVLTSSQITALQTGSNGLGSFRGDRLASLQQDNLAPGEYTIQFQVIEAPIDGLGFATYAYVTWKVKGQQIERIVSVFSGSAISGVADAVHVQLQDQSGRSPTSVHLTGNFTLTNGLPNFTSSDPHTIANGQQIIFSSQPNLAYVLPNGMNGTSGILSSPYTGASGSVGAYTLANYKVGVSLSKGTRPTTMQPPVLLTQGQKTVGPGGTENIPFPIDAGIISVLVTAVVTGLNPQASAADGIVSFFDATGFITFASYIPNNFSGWYPVPPGSVEMVFINNNNSDSLDFSFQWGIEG